MTNKGTNHNQSILDMWRDKTSKRLVLSNGLTVIIQLKNELALLFDDEGLANPLTTLISAQLAASPASAKKKKGGEKEKAVSEMNLSDLMDDPEKVYKLKDGLKKLMIEVIIEPRLIEQGYEDGISANVIPLEAQMEIFEALFGNRGELAQAKNFPESETTDLETL